MKKAIKEMIAKALEKAKETGDLELSTVPEVVIEEPKDKELGDYSTTIAMLLAKPERKNPKVIAETICKHLQNSNRNLDSAESAGPGFINLRMSKSFYCNRLKEAILAGKKFGSSDFTKNQKINL